MTITALFWNPGKPRHHGARHHEEKHPMASRRRRRFGVAHNPRRAHRARRVMRNAWTEEKTKTVTKKVAPEHSRASTKSWKDGARRAAYNAKYGMTSVPSALKEEKAPPKGKGSRKPKQKPATRSSGKAGGKKKVKSNPSYRRRRRSAKRNAGRVVHRRRRASRNPSHRRHRRHVRRNPGMGGIIIKSAAMAAGLYAVGVGTQWLLDNYLLKADDKGKTLLPESLLEYAPAIVAGGATAALLAFIGSKYAPSALKTYKDPIMYGGVGATVLALLFNVTMTDDKGVKRTLADSIKYRLTSSGSASTAGYGVFGYTPVAGLGAPLAVEGVIQIPGGPLAVEGAGFGGYLGTTLSNSVLGTQTKTIGPAPNPFAPGLREGNRGTWNEPSAAEVADSGSLSGNIFS